MAYVETRLWPHVSWSPAQIEVNGTICEVSSTSCLLLVAEQDETSAIVMSRALPPNVATSEPWKAMMAADPAMSVDIGELLSRCRATMGTQCGAILISGVPFDAHRILDLGAALPYERGLIGWTYEATGMVVFVGKQWRAALRMCKAPNGIDNHIPVLPDSPSPAVTGHAEGAES